MALLENYSLLIESVCAMDGVSSVGKSGGEKLPEQKESDIDVFVFCERIPSATARRAAVQKAGPAVSNPHISENKGRFWGFCDFVTLDQTEVCLMYFTILEMNGEVEAVLSGSRPDREDEYFYPTGRCASLLTMHAIYDPKGYIAGVKEKLSLYPKNLAERLFAHHINKINDAEDFERAVSRGDVLFYHATLEGAIDHFLQALFALNRCFFPSRKRSLQHMKNFDHQPKNCAERLLQAVALGARPETLPESYEIWSALCGELLKMTVCGE